MWNDKDFFVEAKGAQKKSVLMVHGIPVAKKVNPWTLEEARADYEAEQKMLRSCRNCEFCNKESIFREDCISKGSIYICKVKDSYIDDILNGNKCKYFQCKEEK